MKKNTAKHLSYAEAWRRINSAIEQDFFFEAVTLCESIISDRLLSYVHGVEPDANLSVHTSFGMVISRWRKLAVGSLPDVELPDSDTPENLAVLVDRWRDARNNVVHGLAKSAPGTPTAHLDSFMERANRAAIDGRFLAREVCKWHKGQLRLKTI